MPPLNMSMSISSSKPQKMRMTVNNFDLVNSHFNKKWHLPWASLFDHHRLHMMHESLIASPLEHKCSIPSSQVKLLKLCQKSYGSLQNKNMHCFHVLGTPHFMDPRVRIWSKVEYLFLKPHFQLFKLCSKINPHALGK